MFRAERCSDISRSGGLEVCRNLLSARDVDSRVHEKTVVLLVYLCKDEDLRDTIREVGLLDLLLRDVASESQTVKDNATAALVNAMINNTANQNFVREQGHLKTVVEQMESPVARTRQNTCWLLKKLAAQNNKNKDAMRELGVLEKLVPMLGERSNPEVQEHAVALLVMLLDKHSRNKSHFKDVAGGPAALFSLKV